MGSGTSSEEKAIQSRTRWATETTGCLDPIRNVLVILHLWYVPGWHFSHWTHTSLACVLCIIGWYLSTRCISFSHLAYRPTVKAPAKHGAGWWHSVPRYSPLHTHIEYFFLTPFSALFTHSEKYPQNLNICFIKEFSLIQAFFQGLWLHIRQLWYEDALTIHYVSLWEVINWLFLFALKTTYWHFVTK